MEEWVQDFTGQYSTGPATDPTGPATGRRHVRARRGTVRPRGPAGPGYCDPYGGDAGPATGLRIVMSDRPAVTSFRIDAKEMARLPSGNAEQYLHERSDGLHGLRIAGIRRGVVEGRTRAPRRLRYRRANGTKTVYFKVRNAAGESAVVSDMIVLNEGLTEESIMLPGDVPLELTWCPAGTFMMGAGQSASGGAKQQRQVTLTRGFWMAKHELTKRQWQAVMGTTAVGRTEPGTPMTLIVRRST